jgi:arginine exporter protein ArgO
MERPNAWRILDAGIAIIMFALALSMLRAGGLI